MASCSRAPTLATALRSLGTSPTASTSRAQLHVSAALGGPKAGSKVKKTSMRDKVIHKPRIAGAKPSSGSPKYKRGMVDFDGGKQLEAANLRDTELSAPSSVAAFVPASLKGKTEAGGSAVGHTLAFTPQSVSFLRESAGARLPTGQQPMRLPRSLDAENAFVRRQTTVVRTETLELAAILDRAKKTSSQELRYVLTGSPGSGRTTALMQAVAYARESGFIVLYVPSALPIVSDVTAYAYDETRQIYVQDQLAAVLLQGFVKANAETLGGVKMTDGTKVDAFVKSALSKPEGQSDALEAVLEVLGAQTDVPVLIAVDVAQALYGVSQTRGPLSFEPLPSFALSLARLLLSYASPTGRKLERGAVLLAMSANTGDGAHSGRRLELALGVGVPEGAYETVEHDHPAYARLAEGLQKLEIGPLSPLEAASAVQALDDAKLPRVKLSDSMFLEAYIAGAGNAREMTRNLRRTLATEPAQLAAQTL